jgi:hypothetical protein
MKERATELEFLNWFYSRADFGPADSDVRHYMKKYFISSTDKNLPLGYNYDSDGETNLDE